MSLVELAKEKARNPKPREGIINIQDFQNLHILEFTKGDIGLVTLRQRLRELGKDRDIIELLSPGPLYGLLRKIGLGKQKANEITEEERAHFLVAKQYGLNSRIIIEFSEANGNKNSVLPSFMDVYFVYDIPEDIDDDRMRTIIEEISLAPEFPSADDLAKLPSQT
jgi:hypothetical protein